MKGLEFPSEKDEGIGTCGWGLGRLGRERITGGKGQPLGGPGDAYKWLCLPSLQGL